MRSGRVASGSVLLLALAALASDAPSRPPVQRFGTVALFSPRRIYLEFQPFVDYLTASTGTPWELAIRPTYESLIEDLCSGQVKLARLGPYAYLRAHQACGATPVVRPRSGGEPARTTVVLVRLDSRLQSLRDLSGKTFGFAVPMSTASHLVPRLMLEEAGLRVGVDVSCRFFSSYEQAARAVIMGEVDACGLDSLVAETYVGRVLRVLVRSEEIPSFPLVASPRGPPTLTQDLLHVLVDVPGRDANAAARIRSWDPELGAGFLPASDADYDPVRRMASRVFGPANLTLRSSQLECRSPGP